MKFKYVGNLTLEVSIKKKYKDLLKPVYQEMKRCGIRPDLHTWEEDWFRIIFDLEAYSYDHINKMLNEIREFYPETEVKLNLYNW